MHCTAACRHHAACCSAAWRTRHGAHLQAAVARVQQAANDRGQVAGRLGLRHADVQQVLSLRRRFQICVCGTLHVPSELQLECLQGLALDLLDLDAERHIGREAAPL